MQYKIITSSTVDNYVERESLDKIRVGLLFAAGLKQGQWPDGQLH